MFFAVWERAIVDSAVTARSKFQRQDNTPGRVQMRQKL